jgi:hypothetical protein
MYEYITIRKVSLLVKINVSLDVKMFPFADENVPILVN